MAFASGVAAIAALFLHTLKAGDHLVMSDVTYAAASEFANQKLPNLGIEVTRVDTSDPQNVRAALRPNTRLVYLETPVNPLLRLTDVEAVAADRPRGRRPGRRRLDLRHAHRHATV